MPFRKINVEEEIEKACKDNLKLKKELELTSIEFELLKQLARVRDEKGILQKDIAEITGFSQQAISRIEKFGHSPTLKNFIKYIDALGLEIKLVEKNRE